MVWKEACAEFEIYSRVNNRFLALKANRTSSGRREVGSEEGTVSADLPYSIASSKNSTFNTGIERRGTCSLDPTATRPYKISGGHYHMKYEPFAALPTKVRELSIVYG